MKIVRYSFAVLLILACVWFLLPLLAGITQIGMFYPVIVLAPLIVVLFKPDLLKGGRAKKIILSVVGVCYLLGFLACGVTLGIMAKSAKTEAPPNATAVVLGCMVYDSGPSRMLLDRCDAAYDYLIAHPDAVCIATGGQGHDEPMSEAEAIFDILPAKGIEPHRIYLEDTSTDTKENLANAAAMIAANELADTVAIATDGFHEFRAGIYAEQAGLTPYAIPSETYLFVFPGYWAREILAVWEAIFLS